MSDEQEDKFVEEDLPEGEAEDKLELEEATADLEEASDQDECVDTTFWQDATTTASVTVGLVMLLVGLALGYFVYPSLQPKIAERFGPEPTPTAVAQQQPSQDQQQALEEVMNLLVSETNHFKGEETAPVTIIEFADFQ